MRNLDELLQDIPLEELMRDPGADENETRDISSSKRKKHISKKTYAYADEGEPPAIRLRSRVSVAAAAAVIAVIAAAAAAVSAKMEHGTRIEPKAQTAQTEKNQPDPIKTESEPVSSQSNSTAEELYKAMLSYLSQHPDDGISDAAEMQMLVDLEDIEGENGEIGLKLEQLMQKDLPGRAFFRFEDGKLQYAQWSDWSSPAARVELYPAVNGRKTVNALGEKIDNSKDPGYGLDFYSRVCIQRTGSEPHYEDISDTPWLTEWYEAFLSAAPEEVTYDDPKMHELIFEQSAEENAKAVSIYFNYGGSIISIAPAPAGAKAADLLINGKLYKYSDTSVLEQAGRYL